MQTLTPEEINRINDLKASGYKPNEILTQIASTRTGTPLASSYTPVSGIGGPTETQQDIAGTFSDIGGSFKKFTSNINRAATKEGLSRSQRFAGGLLTVPTLALDLVGDVITGTAKTAVGQKTEEAVGGAIASGVSAAMGTDFAKGITNWYDNLDPASQYTASQIIAPLAEAVTETGTGGIFGKLLSRGKKAVPDRAAIEKAVTEAATEARTGNIAPATRIVNATVDPIERQKAVDNLTKAYMESMVEDRTAINNRLDDIASQVNRYSDTDVTRETLISNLANEGYIPVPEGRRARFEDSIRDVQSRQSALMSDMEGLLQEVRDTVSTSEFYDAVRASLRNDPRVGTDINSALRRIDELERGAKAQYGNTLRPLDVNKLKVEGNMKRGDVGKNVDPIVTDAWSNVARTANEWMNSKIDNELFKRTNAEWSRLQTLEDTMMALRNQQIDVGVIGRALGSYLTVVTGSSAGLATGGPGGLVVAGILSKMGADALADMLRKKAFSPEATQIIRDVMRNDDMLREELKRTAKTTQAKNELDDFVRALPAPKEGAADASIYVPQPAPQAGVRSAGTPIEKTSQTGKLLNPEEQAVINQQAGRFKTPETFINAVKNNPRWLAKLEAAGVTPEQVAKVVFSGTAAYFLVSYTDENGLLPVGVIALSALPANERATVIKEATKAAKTTGKTLKLSDEVADDVLKSLNMESAVEKITRASDFDADDVARLDALQQTSKKAPLTDEELLEAKAIMEKYGDVFPDGKLPKADVTPQTTALLEEAKGKTLEEFVRAQGTPVYHGTSDKIDEFRTGVMGENTGAESAKKGFFFASSKENALAYKPKISKGADDVQKEINNALRAELKKRGITDSITLPNSATGKYTANIAPPKELLLTDRGKDMLGDIKTQWKSNAIKDINRKKMLMATTPEQEKWFDEILSVYDNVIDNFSLSKKKATEPIGELKTVYLNYENPKIIIDRPEPITQNKPDPGRQVNFSEEIDRARQEGHDALIIKNTKDPLPTDVYVVFEPSQIKTRTQLEDIWKQANRTASADGSLKGALTDTPSLMEEAKKLKTIQELYKDKDFLDLKERAEQLKITVRERKDGTVIEWRKLQNQIDKIEDTVRQNQEQFRKAALKERDLEIRKNNPDVDVLDARATTLLQKESKGKTLDEFIGLVRGSSTQYGAYKPQMRRFVAPQAKRLSEIEGIDPNQVVTIYRGIDDQTGRVSVRINSGDFVTTNYDEALAYTDSPGKVAELRVKAKTLIEEYPDEFDVDTFMDSASEFIYQPKDIVKITDTQLEDIWKQANK